MTESKLRGPLAPKQEEPTEPSALKGTLAPKSTEPKVTMVGPLPTGSTESKLRGTLIGVAPETVLEKRRLTRAEFDAYMLRPGSTFQSSDRRYTVRNQVDGRAAVLLDMVLLATGKNIGTANWGLDRLWDYYGDGRIWFD